MNREMAQLIARWEGRQAATSHIDIKLMMKAISKERPRSGKSGHMYTPQRTKDFEKAVADEARAQLEGPVTYPIKIKISIIDAMPKGFNDLQRLLAREMLLLPTRGDLDNKVKAITDGLNGVAYIDDDQIQHIDAARRYGKVDMIFITIIQKGLSPQQLEQALYSMKAINGGKTKIDTSGP